MLTDIEKAVLAAWGHPDKPSMLAISLRLGTTRSTVAGVLYRLRRMPGVTVPERDSPAPASITLRASKPKLKPKLVEPKAPRREAVRKIPVAVGAPEPPALPPPVPFERRPLNSTIDRPLALYLPTAAIVYGPVSMANIEKHQCRYPLSTDAMSEEYFCGQRTVGRTLYCEEHTVTMRNPTFVKRDHRL